MPCAISSAGCWREMTEGAPSGTLVLVGTPIGNLGDLAPRASQALAEADVIFAEDTRRSSRLVPAGSRLVSYFDSNAASRQELLLGLLREGRKVALVTDAGMPGISDPCFRAVRTAIDAGAKVEVIPGPCAAIAALVASGLPPDRFVFEGFLPGRRGRKASRLAGLASEPRTMVFYIPPHDLPGDLEAMLEAFGDRQACVAREMTKIHEELVRGNLSTLLSEFTRRAPRGEVTLVVAGCATLTN